MTESMASTPVVKPTKQPPQQKWSSGSRCQNIGAEEKVTLSMRIARVATENHGSLWHFSEE